MTHEAVDGEPLSGITGSLSAIDWIHYPLSNGMLSAITGIRTAAPKIRSDL